MRDSAGITIVENRTPRWQAGEKWVVSGEPILQIGVQQGDPDYELHRVQSARRLSDGRIVVANGGTTELRVYSPAGEFVRSFGRRGAGPAEFAGLHWVQVLTGDTILAVDAGLRRITAFSPDGRLLSTTQLAAAAGAETEWPADPRFEDGTFVMGWDDHGGALGNQDYGIARGRMTFLRYSADGDVLDTLAVTPGVELAIVQEGGRTSSMFAPLGRMTTWAVGDASFYVGTQETNEVQVYDREGLSRIIRLPAEDLRIQADALERLRAELTAAVGDAPGAEEFVARYVGDYPRPATRPAYGRLIVDRQGALWISESFNPLVSRTPEEWNVVDPGGAWLGGVALPADFEAYEIGADYILGRWTGVDGVEHVRMYALNRTPEARR